ncbi:MAG: hypothetical protein WBQ94_20515 [Terracidiphilus sp.]
MMSNRKAASTVSPMQASSAASELVAAAERELAAYYKAVSATYGPEEAMRAAQVWIEELERMDGEEPKNAPRRFDGSLSKWRNVTITAAHRFASRVVDRPTGQ